MVIGNFDGVHLGHCTMVHSAVQEAQKNGLAPLVLTFYPHPAEVLGRGKQEVLTPLDYKIELLGRAAPELRVVVERFTRELAGKSPRQFAEELLVGELACSLVSIALEREATEARLAHQALHDALTGLPNRSLLNDRIDTALRRAKRDHRMVATVFLDLDHFKDINDSFGHAVGDAVLKQAATRLLECVREEDTIARLGGDEFVILIENIEDVALTINAAERILTCLNPPLTVEHQEFFIGASIGRGESWPWP